VKNFTCLPQSSPFYTGGFTSVFAGKLLIPKQNSACLAPYGYSEIEESHERNVEVPAPAFDVFLVSDPV